MLIKYARRVAAIAGLAIAAAVAVPASPASALTLTSSGTLSFVSDPGDPIGGGTTASYLTSNGDQISVTSDDSGTDSNISAQINGTDGTSWSLELRAPGGRALAAGTYNNAAGYPGPDQAELHFISSRYSLNYGCYYYYDISGSFTITDVVFGPYGYVQQLDADFTEYCGTATAALHGQIHILNPTAPPVLAPTVSIAPAGTVSTVDGDATVGGTVTCNVPVTLGVWGTVTEVVKKSILNGNYTATVVCTPGTPVSWSARATPPVPFTKGAVAVTATTAAIDPTYGVYVYASQTAEVQLTSSKSV